MSDAPLLEGPAASRDAPRPTHRRHIRRAGRRSRRDAAAGRWSTPPAMWQDIRPADIATIANAFLGLAAMYLASGGRADIAWLLVFGAVIVDGIDGAIARLGGGGGPLGHTLDALADTTTFVAAPAFIIATSGHGALGLAAAAAFLTAGLLRLARFHSLDVPFFFGLSTPGAALAVGLTQHGPAGWMPVAALLAAGLMVTRLRLPKLRGPIGLAAVAVLLLVITAFAMAPRDVGGTDSHQLAAAFGAVMLIGYLIFGPTAVARRA